MTRSTLAGATALWLATLAMPAEAQVRWIPEAGSHGYRYETITRIPDMPENGYRLDYDLVSDGKGGLVAVVKAAAHRAGGEWSDAEIDDSCRKALRAQGSELARITLSPITPETATKLGLDFMAECAPADIFFPMSDILTITLIQVAPEFRLAQLAKPGDTSRFPGYATHHDRLNTVITATAPGGSVTFSALAPGRATIEWASDPIQLKIVHRGAYMGADVTLTGAEPLVFRLEIDPGTGVLLGAADTRGQLDMTMSLPGDYSQPLAIARELKIVPRR